MLDRIDTMNMAMAMGRHATARQRVVAQNIANADTPGYRAADLGDFTQSYRAAPRLTLRGTDLRHVSGSDWGMNNGARVVAGAEASPDGNTVSLEDELVRQADTRREFDLALTVFQSGLGLMRSSLGRR